MLALGFPVALVLAYIFEWHEGEFRRTDAAGCAAIDNRQRIWILGLVGLLFASAVIGTYWAWRPKHEPVPLVEKSVAVLPFANLSEDPQNAFFTDGVHDEILSDLAKIADLQVISRTSVMQYKSDGARNMREIGQQLGVAYVVEGSVRRAGNRVRINAQLIDTRTDAHVWSEQFEKDLADVFAIQSEVAEAIVNPRFDEFVGRLAPR